MAKQSAIPLYQDTPLDSYGSTELARIWLAALDAIIPATPLDYADLFRIIGPSDDETAQNLRVVQILGYDVNKMEPNRKGILAPLQRRAGQRLVQRYRRASLGVGGQTRGVSDRARRDLLAKLGPIARDLILRRFMQLAENSGLGGSYQGKFHISQSKARPQHHDGGVESHHMETTVDYAHAGDWESAAWEYWHEWLLDWGIPDAQAIDTDVESATWVLWLGYPSPLDTETGGAGDPREWMFRDDLAEYHANAESGE